MAVMVFLKSLADAALAFLVLGSAAVHFGADPMMSVVTCLVICISQVISFLICQKNPKLRMIPYVIPFACIFLPGRSIAWAVLCGLVFAYEVFTGATRRYMADRDAQKTIFKITLGLTAAMLVILLIASAVSLSYTIVILSCLISASCSILLLRSLRHDPEVYGQASYQAVNIGVIAAAAAGAAVLGSGPVIKGLGTVLKTVYIGIAYAFLFLLNYVIRFFVWIYHLLKELFSGNVTPPQEQRPPVQIDLSGAEEMFPKVSEYMGLPLWVKIIGIAVAAALVALILALIFRKLAGRRAQVQLSGAQTVYSQVPDQEEKKRFSGQVQGVRKQYRKYLNMVEKEGVEIGPENTSADIIGQAPGVFHGAEAKELRELYIEARYNGTADKAAAERAKEIIKELKTLKG